MVFINCKCKHLRIWDFLYHLFSQIGYPQIGDIRLVSENETHAGNLQVYVNNQWGNICFNEALANKMADVACHQLGYNGAYYVIEIKDTSPYILPSLQCNTNETMLFQCNGNIDFGAHFQCSTNKKYFISCEGKSDLVSSIKHHTGCLHYGSHVTDAYLRRQH